MRKNKTRQHFSETGNECVKILIHVCPVKFRWWSVTSVQSPRPQTICGYMKETTTYQNNEVKFNRLNRIEGARSFMWPHRNQIFVFFNQIKHLDWHANGRHEMFKQIEEILIIDLVLPILMKLILILFWPNGVTRIRIVKKLTCDETFDQLV
jgi:hypothetical protein